MNKQPPEYLQGNVDAWQQGAASYVAAAEHGFGQSRYLFESLQVIGVTASGTAHLTDSPQALYPCQPVRQSSSCSEWSISAAAP